MMRETVEWEEGWGKELPVIAVHLVNARNGLAI